MNKYEQCPDLTELINLWLVFAGDNETWREVKNHIAICDQCDLNIELSEIWREQWIIDHTSEAQPGENAQNPESEWMGINAAYAVVQDGWKRTIAPINV